MMTRVYKLLYSLFKKLIFILNGIVKHFQNDLNSSRIHLGDSKGPYRILYILGEKKRIHEKRKKIGRESVARRYFLSGANL